MRPYENSEKNSEIEMQTDKSEALSCFISYSWDNEQHRAWVRKLATRLHESGVNAILDQFHCAPGMDLARFMEKSVREADFVLLVCTPNFAQKADAGVGGGGYEKAIVTGEIFAGEARETKFVPLLREGDAKESLPSYLKSRLFVDFREDAFFGNRLEELLRHFYAEPLYPAPPIGPRPQFGTTQPGAAPLKKPALYPEITNSIGMKFVLIPAGSFTMGSRISPEKIVDWFGGEKEWYESERHHRSVILVRPFYLQTPPVTQGQWQRVMRNNPSHFEDGGEDCPAERVSWEDAWKFIEKFNQAEKTTNCRLPSEAEWEYACRAGSETEFWFGNDAKRLGEFAWYTENSDGKTHPVGRKEPNAWGLYDMHGNVQEWMEDDWHGSFEEAPVDGSAWIDKPRVSGRVLHGGAWNHDACTCRSAARYIDVSVARLLHSSFRLAGSVSLGL